MSKDIEYWKQKEQVARNNMQYRKTTGKGVLIEISLAGMSVDGSIFCPELESKLKKGLELYQVLVAKDFSVTIYLSGGRADTDDVSMRTLAKLWLAGQGVDGGHILGESVDQLYSKSRSVVSQTDVCKVAATLFGSRDFAELCSVCSASEITKKAFVYLEQGYIPKFYVISMQATHTLFSEEFFTSIPRFMQADEDTTNKKSNLGQNEGVNESKQEVTDESKQEVTDEAIATDWVFDSTVAEDNFDKIEKGAETLAEENPDIVQAVQDVCYLI